VQRVDGSLSDGRVRIVQRQPCQEEKKL
jgi:hypothetical protein